MSKKALIVQGGWEGHDPEKIAGIFQNILLGEGWDVEMSGTLEIYSDSGKLRSLDLIVHHWTMGEIKDEYIDNILNAVENGTGLAGCHGGLCDSFRTSTKWHFLTGSQWVDHPGGCDVTYTVNIKKNSSSPIVKDIEDFKIKSEQYYLHTDPAVNVLATTRFPLTDGPYAVNGEGDMPVVYTKLWGKGRIFYSSLGHVSADFNIKEVTQLMKNGFLWAAR